MLQNLLMWSGRQSGKIQFHPQDSNAPQLIAEAISHIKPSAEVKGVRIEAHISELPVLNFDYQMVSTILRNLLWNAIKYTHKGGTISVSVTVDPELCTFCVRDTGIGMNEAQMANLFPLTNGMFTKGTNQESGTGLGLLICKELVDVHQGRIWVESTPGQGSSFYFSIPQ